MIPCELSGIELNHPLLQLIGGLLLHDEDPDYRWFGSTYNRVMTEVLPPGTVSRLIGYESRHGVRFFGAQIEGIVEIPKGMVAWELHDDAWTVRDARGEICRYAPLTWHWRAISENGRWSGEFSAVCPEAWGGGTGQFQLTANAYLMPDKVCDDDITLIEPDPAWPQQFEEFAAWLQGTVGRDVARRIEHYGSTAIPGIPAKPVIDMLVEVPSFDIARRHILPLVNGEAWEYWWYHDHMVVIKRQALMGRRTHHLHLAPAGHRLWEGIAFRDYLRAHPDAAARYAALKRELAAQYQEDREGYTNAKAAFVREMTARAQMAGYR